MAKKLFILTGPPGVGKTTVVLKVIKMLKERGISVGGIISKEVKSCGRRVGFEMIDVATGERETLASLNGEGARMGKYKVNLKGLAEFASKKLESAIKNFEVVVCDEVGPMELLSPEFRRVALKLREVEKLALIVVHYKMKDPVIKAIKEDPSAELFEVTYENRDELPRRMFNSIVGVLGQV